MNKIGIYVHIPFCESKCIYCDFASSVCNLETKQKYFESLISEIKNCRDKRAVSTIYFGGGTPSSVNVSDIKKVLDAIYENFDIDKNAEITIECNPNSATFEKLEEYRKMGFNRISFGVQSLHDETLKLIGRRHNSMQAFEAIDNAKKAGFKNISADLMIGLPGQSEEDLISDAEKLVNLNIKHISAYMLQVEENTPLFKKVESGEIIVPDEDECVKMYEALVKFLAKNGLNRYEISNFSREGWNSQHNMNYWKMGEYLGFGLAAHSFINSTRIANPCNMSDYLNRKGIVKEKIDNRESVVELIMLGLRCNAGVDTEKLINLGYDIKNSAYYEKFINKGIIKLEKNMIYLNPEYYGVSNSIICDLIP